MNKNRKRKAILSNIAKTVALAGRWQNLDPGRGLSYDVTPDGKLHIECDLNQLGPLSKSGKSWTIATSRGPYNLQEWDWPWHYCIVNVCKRVPAKDRIDVRAITAELATLGDDDDR